MEAHALQQQGWTISAIARHLRRNRRTVRNYLNGVTEPGARKKPEVDPFQEYVEYITLRLTADPHVEARTLCDELEDLGYTQSYQTLTRQIRARGLRPICPQCVSATCRPNAVIEHSPGEETQWDWVDLPDPPAAWGWGKNAHLLVGSLAHSGRWRGYLAADMTQSTLIEGLDRISRSHGGLTRVWRFDRMATVCHPDSGSITNTFAGVAKYYAVSVAICPPRRGNRKGVVERANRTAAQRWWRTLPDDVTVEQAQAGLDRFCTLRGDTRMRPTADGKTSVATIAAREPLAALPLAPYPAVLTETRKVSRQALVAWKGNQYSVPPELAMGEVTVSHQLGADHLDITTAGGIVIARHRLASEGAGAMVRDHGHVLALDTVAMATANTGAPHRRKQRLPPNEEARRAADVLRNKNSGNPNADIDSATVIDMSAYERAAQNRTTLP